MVYTTPDEQGTRGTEDSHLWRGNMPWEERTFNPSALVDGWVNLPLINEYEDVVDGVGDPNLVDWITTRYQVTTDPLTASKKKKQKQKVPLDKVLSQVLFSLNLSERILKSYAKWGCTAIETGQYIHQPSAKTKKKRKELAEKEMKIFEEAIKKISAKKGKLQYKVNLAGSLLKAISTSEKPTPKRLKALQAISL